MLTEVARNAVTAATSLLASATANLAQVKSQGNAAAVTAALAAVSTATQQLSDAKGKLQQLHDKADYPLILNRFSKKKTRPRTAQRRGIRE